MCLPEELSFQAHTNGYGVSLRVQCMASIKSVFCNQISGSQYFHNEKIQQDATMYQSFIIPYLYEAQHVLGDTPPIIRSLKLHWQPMVFYMKKVVRRVIGGRCQAQYEQILFILCLTASTNYTSNNLPRIKKPEAATEILGS
jgi:hypothetical protein